MKLSQVVADSLLGFQASHIFSLFAKVNCPDNQAITSHQGFLQYITWELLRVNKHSISKLFSPSLSSPTINK
jgi:hypothetical protein